jgi:predicted AlkP superfamily phosphohydrolase/phosphomutase
LTSVDSSRPFFKVPADGVHSGIRFNVRGREPRGTVAPGAELDQLVAALRADLLDLVDPDTGERSITSVERVTDIYRGERIADLPDLLVAWNPRAGVVAMSSPRVGKFSATPWEGRAGEHRTGGVLFVRGPGIRPGPVGEIQIVDIAPTIARMLGIDAEGTDGQMIAGLLPAP